MYNGLGGGLQAPTVPQTRLHAQYGDHAINNRSGQVWEHTPEQRVAAYALYT